MEEFLSTHVYSLMHWPWFAALASYMLVGQVAKTAVFTKDRAATHRAWQWGRRTLALHPLVAGLVTGLIWHTPEASVSGWPASSAYFALAGCCSVFAYEVLKGVGKKHGYEITLPGTTSYPPPTTEELQRILETAGAPIDESSNP